MRIISEGAGNQYIEKEAPSSRAAAYQTGRRNRYPNPAPIYKTMAGVWQCSDSSDASTITTFSAHQLTRPGVSESKGNFVFLREHVVLLFLTGGFEIFPESSGAKSRSSRVCFVDALRLSMNHRFV